MGHGRKPDLYRNGNLPDLLRTILNMFSLFATQLMAIAHVVTVYHACTRGYGEGWMDNSETDDRLAIMKVRRRDRISDDLILNRVEVTLCSGHLLRLFVGLH